jgi:hypothetical protein
LEHKISLHKAASEVRCIVNFNNGSTTGPNGVSVFSRREILRAEMLFTSAMPTHTNKHGVLRALLSLKRAN